ncbi:MAG: short-chain dehydrogenase [Candidatus Kapabacteria bacterium]|nr:short-chain dehydrogenase [Candidatus Kapabacteria bacterium]
MEIEGKKILLLGGWGLVGSAVANEVMKYSPSEIIMSSLRQSEAEQAVANLEKEFPNSSTKFKPEWGNIFVRKEWKDEDFNKVLDNAADRQAFISDIFMELDDKILKNSSLYSMIVEHNPDIIIDCINTATGIAYMDIYSTTAKALKQMETGEIEEGLAEKIIASTYIPQLIRHVQIMYNALIDAKVKMYFKVGTSGTGGMGFNIPYTHSEERPSRVLLSKTAVGGAHSLLLFLLARTPGGPIVKEIKPTAAIAWKKIAYEEVLRKGKAIKLVDMDPLSAKEANGELVFDDYSAVRELTDNYKSVFIDTGENGIFSRAEFETISSLGQMELVTPEEIAAYLVYEIRGGNTGHDVIQALDAATLGPTYRAGVLRSSALEQLKKLELENGVESLAFEQLGPPRLAKLLFEANIIKHICGSMHNLLSSDSLELSKKAEEYIKQNEKIRSEMLSIGLVLLLSDGKKYLRGKDIKIPVHKTETSVQLTEENIEKWCYEGWIDLRPKNFDEWKLLIKMIMDDANSKDPMNTSSKYVYTKQYWDNFETFNEGKIVAWVFENIDKGWRFKR